MKITRFKLPADTPEHACGRCIWWAQKTPDGWGNCCIFKEKRWHACMVCPEYEYEP